jgi:NAD(P)H-quinone oxidoreductase subunit 2
MTNDFVWMLARWFDAPIFNALAAWNVHLVAPELCVAAGLLFALFKGVGRHQQDAWLYAILSLFAGLVCLFCQYDYVFTPQLLHQPLHLSGGLVSLDGFSWVMRLMVMLGATMTVMMSRSFVAGRSKSPAEFYAVLMAAVLGAMFLVGARDLIMLFVALETMGISSYILSGYFRDNTRSAEASLKYLTYGGVCSALLLFGFSLLYGLSGGATQLPVIGQALSTTPLLAGAGGLIVKSLAAVLVFGAVSFKLSLAPFHMWTPDVYEGAPTPVAAFLSVVSKTAAFAVAIQLVQTLFADVPAVQPLLAAICGLSMVWGNISAVMQTDLKRMLAFSTVAQAGYMALGLVANTSDSLTAMVYYLMGYLFTNMGAFAVVKAIEQDLGTTRIADMAGLVSKRPVAATLMTIFLISLAGLPVTVGFFAKFFLFQAVVVDQPALLGLIILALLTSVVSLFYYLNVVRIMVVQAPADAVRYLKSLTYRLVPSGTSMVALVSAYMVVLMGLFANLSLDMIHQGLAPSSLPDMMMSLPETQSVLPATHPVAAVALPYPHIAGQQVH